MKRYTACNTRIIEMDELENLVEKQQMARTVTVTSGEYLELMSFVIPKSLTSERCGFLLARNVPMSSCVLVPADLILRVRTFYFVYDCVNLRRISVLFV